MEVSVLFLVVAELVQVLQVDSLHEITSLAIMRKQPNLGEFALQTLVHADQVELVNGTSVFALSVNQLVLALVVEFQGLSELSGT